MVRAAVSLTGAATRMAGAATAELIDGAGASFKQIFAQKSPAAATPELNEAAATEQLQTMQTQLLAAVRSVLAHAGIDLSQSQPFQLVIAANGKTSIGQGHPLQGTLEMVLQNDETVAATASRLVALRSAHALQAEPLKITITSGEQLP